MTAAAADEDLRKPRLPAATMNVTIMEAGSPPTPLLPEQTPAPGYAPPGYAPPGREQPADDPHAALGAHRQSFFRRRVAPLGAALLAFLAKIKAIILFLPKFKLLVTAGSMAVSIAAYTTIWGFQFAIGFVILLLVHEWGHVIALRREGIKASAPMFIPFMGAVISARSLGDNALAEARVGLAGPILGTIGSAVCIVIWQITGHDFWRALAFTGLFLNLFNLLPVVPLDGGRAMAAMTPWLWFAGFAGIVVLAFVFPNPIILIIAVFAAYETYRRWQQRRNGGVEQQAYYRVAPRNRLLVAAVYLGLVALLVVGMSVTQLPRTLG
jgi:Zn-dependent protease